MAADIPAKHLATLLDLTVARVGQLAKDGIIQRLPNGRYPPGAITQYIKWIRESKRNKLSEGDELARDFLKAKTEYTQSQNVKLKRQLALEAGKLIRAEYLDKILLAFLKHYETQTDWIRSNRMGDSELLEAHLASVKGAQRECHNLGYIEGKHINDAD